MSQQRWCHPSGSWFRTARQFQRPSAMFPELGPSGSALMGPTVGYGGGHALGCHLSWSEPTSAFLAMAVMGTCSSLAAPPLSGDCCVPTPSLTFTSRARAARPVASGCTCHAWPSTSRPALSPGAPTATTAGATRFQVCPSGARAAGWETALRARGTQHSLEPQKGHSHALGRGKAGWAELWVRAP